MRILAHVFIYLGCVMVLAFPPGAKAAQAEQASSPSEIISGVTAAEMAEWLRGFGWAAEVLEEDEKGFSDIQIKFTDYSSFLKFRDCSEGTPRRCGTLLFFANFDLGRRISSSDPEIMNKYNDRYIIGRAYFLELPKQETDQVGIDFSISLKGGVTREHLTLEALKWRGIINDFVANFRGE